MFVLPTPESPIIISFSKCYYDWDWVGFDDEDVVGYFFADIFYNLFIEVIM